MPEIPLSVGRKLELLRAFVFDKFPYTSPYTHTFVRVCIILPCMYMYVYISYIQCIYIHDTEAPRVLHFSALIIHACTMYSLHV